MGKLNLVIADMDKNYLKNLGNYLMVHYSGRFDIYLFSSSEELRLFLKSSVKYPDILLYSYSFLKEAMVTDKIHTIILLSENNASHPIEDGNTINKYRHAESLVQEIFHIYSKDSLDPFIPEGKNAKKNIYAVHSASGGTGKTSVAVGLSMLAARRELKSLYLNFESTPSTSFYFKGKSDRTLSDVIYYLKDKGNNLAVKLEGCCCCDSASGVHYFLPPESICEFEELLEEDIDLLLETIRVSSLFDIVFIDLPSGLSRRNNIFLGSCDRVIDICDHRAFSGYMKDVMDQDPKAGGAKGRNEILSGSFHILNKYSESAPGDWYEKEYTDRFCVIIKESEKLKYNHGDRLLIDIDPAFSASVGRLLDLLVTSCGEICRSVGGVAFD